LTEQGAYLRKAGNQIIVEKKGETLIKISAHRVNNVLLYGNIQFTTQALKLLLNHGVELALLTQSGKIFGQFTPPLSKNILLRMSQFKLFSDDSICHKQAKRLLEAKLDNSKEVLKQFVWNKRDIDLSNQIRQIEKQIGSIEKQNSQAALNGVEGIAASAYFNAFRSVFIDQSVFNKRSKRPPKDPSNALLSFCYVLLGFLIQSHLNAVGFDPYLGFYHKTAYGRPSLAIDIVEVFRAPIVDRFVVRLFNLGIMKKDDFQPSEDGGFRLDSNGIKKFFKQWDEHIKSSGFMNILRTQVDTLREVCLEKKEYPDYYTFKAQ